MCNCHDQKNLPTHSIFAASDAIITLFVGQDIALEDLDEIHNEFMCEANDASNALIIVGVVLDPGLLDKRVISIVVSG